MSRGGGHAEDAPRRSLGSHLAARAFTVLIAFLQTLPERRVLDGAAVLGRGWARFGLPRTRVGLVNLRIAFPEWSEERRRRVLADSFANLARSVVEFARVPKLSPEQLAERVTIEGLGHLAAAQSASKTGGVLMLTAHFGSWELMAAAASAAGYPLTAIQRPRDDAALDALVAEVRGAGGTELLARGNAARAALRALRGGRLLGVFYDQDSPRSEGVFVPFFGRLACTRDGPARLALRLGVPVVPAFLYREQDGEHHTLRIHPPVALPEGAPDAETATVELAARMTHAIEQAVRERPDLFAWAHRRWRTQPPGEPGPYPSRRRG